MTGKRYEESITPDGSWQRLGVESGREVKGVGGFAEQAETCT